MAVGANHEVGVDRDAVLQGGLNLRYAMIAMRRGQILDAGFNSVVAGLDSEQAVVPLDFGAQLRHRMNGKNWPLAHADL